MSDSTVVPDNSQSVFNFGENQVRVVVRDGEPWFVAADVWAALKLTNPSKAMKVLAPNERSNFKLGRQGDLNIVSEAGLYTLVLRCRDAVKPGTVAYQFRVWVTGEVLPSIRKTGQYQQLVAQVNPEIDYTRISPAQAQDLREIVKAIVDAKIQGHGETWARFQRKFRVNSYLQLPFNRYEEARQYLIAKLPNGYAGVVVEDALPSERIEHAFMLASQAAAKVQRAVFNGVLAGDEDWKHSRYIVKLDADDRSDDFVVRAKQIAQNACILPIERFYSAIEDSFTVDPQTLTQLASACMKRLGNMATRSTKVLPV